MSYLDKFLEDVVIPIPEIPVKEQIRFNKEGLVFSEYYLDYLNYSVLHNPFRKFPYFTACNIDGELFKKIKRDSLFSGKGDKWSKDSRIPKAHQLGNELYSADKSDFDKGHLTKREDVQWGKEDKDAIEAAESTFFFTNAMPQVDRLNRGVWRKIEDYILHQEVVKNDLKICLFTGPIFLENDPDFVTPIKSKTIKIPYLFWKVVYYLKDRKLHRTGFLTSQKGLLEKRRIVKPIVRSDNIEEESLFMDFKDARTYQVQVDFIESMSNLKFAQASEVFVEDSPEELILSGIDVRSVEEMGLINAHINLIL